MVVRKPILILKPGRSQAGAKAVASHIWSLARHDQSYESAFRQVGVIRVNHLYEFWEIPRVFSRKATPGSQKKEGMAAGSVHEAAIAPQPAATLPIPKHFNV